jgi:predicted phage terminase large subunit-like protein
VGDIEHNDPKREGLTHIKVYAIEDKKRQKAELHNGQPAWIERYTLKVFEDRFKTIGYRATRGEYFHEHIDEGLIFKNEWIVWKKTLPREKYDKIVVYCDPSFKDTKDSDYKATVVVGRSGKELHILRAWVRQTTITNMVKVLYDIYETFSDFAQYYIEANMLQDLFMDDIITEGEQRGYQLPIRADKQKKADKFTRIENLSPLFERDLVFFNEAERQNRDMQTLIQQLLSFPEGHDDAPDALQGAASFCQAAYRSAKFNPKMGTFKVSSSRL